MAESSSSHLDEVFIAFRLRDFDFFERVLPDTLVEQLRYSLSARAAARPAHVSPNLRTRAAFIVVGISELIVRLFFVSS